MFRLDYVDMIGKPRVQYFKVKKQAEDRVRDLSKGGLSVVATSWNMVKEPDNDRRLILNETLKDERDV